eukprot:g59548.t1
MTATPTVSVTPTISVTPTVSTTPTVSVTSTRSGTPSPTPTPQINECVAWRSSCDEALDLVDFTGSPYNSGTNTYTIASSSQYSGYNAWKAFTSVPTNYWRGSSARYDNSGNYIGTTSYVTAGLLGEYLDISATAQFVVTQFVLAAIDVFPPTSFALMASNDGGVQWTNLYQSSVNPFTFLGEERTYKIAQPGSYTVYRLVVLTVPAGGTNAYAQIGRMFLRTWCCPSCANTPAESYTCTCDASWAGGGLGKGCFHYNACSNYPRDCDTSFHQTWTSNTLGSWTVTGSSNASSVYTLLGADTASSNTWSSAAAYRIADGTYTGGQSTAGVAGEWVQIAKTTAVVLTSYSFACRYVSGGSTACPGHPVSFALLGSEDAVSWDVLSTISNAQALVQGQERTYQLSAPGPYSYYRFAITKIQPVASGQATMADVYFRFGWSGGTSTGCFNGACSSHKTGGVSYRTTDSKVVACPASFTTPGLFVSSTVESGQSGAPYLRGVTSGGACNYGWHILTKTEYTLSDLVDAQYYVMASGQCTSIGDYRGLNGVGPAGGTACTSLSTKAIDKYWAPQSSGLFLNLPSLFTWTGGSDTSLAAQQISKTNYMLHGVFCALG